jgi:hypothetical protein
MLSLECQPALQRNISLPSSGSEYKLSKKPEDRTLYSYMCENLHHTLNVFQNKVLMRVIGPKGGKIIGGWSFIISTQRHILIQGRIERE